MEKKERERKKSFFFFNLSLRRISSLSLSLSQSHSHSPFPLQGTRSRDLQRYLSELDELDEPYRFAVFKAGGAVLEGKELAELVDAVGVLASLELYPIIVHGSGPQLNAQLEASGVQPQFVGGIRVTDEKTLEVALRVFADSNARLVDALEARGVRTRAFNSGVFEAELLDEQVYGLVGKVSRVQVERLRVAVHQGYVPIVSSVAHTKSGRALNVNADVAARELALAVRPHNTVFLNSAGGINDGEGRTVPAINLAEDYDRLLQQPWVKHGTRLKINEIKAVLEGLPASSSVSVVKPDDVIAELFSRSGTGTCVRLGERILRFDSSEDVTKAGIDMAALRGLFESAFGGRLVDDYFEKLIGPGADKDRLAHLYVTESMRAAAVITREPNAPDGALYMDKLAVHNSFRGLGIAELLWQKICRDVTTLFWRSRVDNSFNSWYYRQCDGSFSAAEWTVFFYGLKKLRDGERCVAVALGMPKSIIRTPGASVAPGEEISRKTTPAPKIRGTSTADKKDKNKDHLK
jgi:acetylglutamate kinase